MATYAIGDIQGCLNSLKKLLKLIQFSPTDDTLWIAGDLVNRGPQSLETLRFIRDLGASAISILGNHDLHLLAHSHGVRPLTKNDTLLPIMLAHDKDALLNWLQARPLLHFCEKSDSVLVHAGIPPIWSLGKARKRAKEVESALQDPILSRDFFYNMYGNEPNTWDKKQEGVERLRVIVNYFTRMRFCNKKGTLELRTNGSPSHPPKGFAPWFTFENNDWKQTNIYFGHWAALEGKTPDSRYIALDTGCVWGGTLTAQCIETGERFSVTSVD